MNLKLHAACTLASAILIRRYPRQAEADDLYQQGWLMALDGSLDLDPEVATQHQIAGRLIDRLTDYLGVRPGRKRTDPARSPNTVDDYPTPALTIPAETLVELDDLIAVRCPGYIQELTLAAYGYSSAEAADLLGISRAAYDAKLVRARKALRL